jgi:CBS domain-containing protein
VERETIIGQLGELFEKHDFSAFPVVEARKVLGIVTKFDFLRAFAFTSGQMIPHYDDLMRRPATNVMIEAIVHVDPTSPLTLVLHLKIRSPDRQLVGMISREDVMRALRVTTADPR